MITNKTCLDSLGTLLGEVLFFKEIIAVLIQLKLR